MLIEVNVFALIVYALCLLVLGGTLGVAFSEIRRQRIANSKPEWPPDPTEEIAALKRTAKAAAEANDRDHVHELQNALAELQKLAALRARVQRERENGFTRR